MSKPRWIPRCGLAHPDVMAPMPHNQLEAPLASLELSELNEMLRTAPAMIYSFTVDEDNQNARFPFVSSGAAQVFGVSDESIMADPVALIGGIVEEDVTSFMASVEESWRTLKEWNWTGRFRSPEHGDGWKWVKCNSMPKRLPNMHTIWYGTCFDVDAHIRLAVSEEKLNASIIEKKLLQARGSLNSAPMKPITRWRRALPMCPIPNSSLRPRRRKTRPSHSSMRTPSTC
jgi:hypothetical protein